MFDPADAGERSWRFLSLAERQGLDTLEEVALAPDDSAALSAFRYTLESTGAFKLPGGLEGATKLAIHYRQTEDERLQPWELARKSRLRADAPDWVPAMRPASLPAASPKPIRLGDFLADRARIRRTPEHQRTVRKLPKIEMLRRQVARGDGISYAADMSQFMREKRPKRKSQESGEADKGSDEDEGVEF